MKRCIFEASIHLPFKTRAVSSGYRPTLLMAGTKVLCNFDSIIPELLKPNNEGVAIIRVALDLLQEIKIFPGQTFDVLEGERTMGYGTINRVLEGQ